MAAIADIEKEIRDFECPKYDECLTYAAKKNRRFDCGGCQGFSKWRGVETVEESRPPKGEEKIMATKKCNKCGDEKDLKEFNHNKSVPDGYDRTCRECMKGIAKQIRLKKKQRDIGYGKRIVMEKEIVKPGPSISEGITLDAQLLKAVKKSAILDFVKNELPRMVEERFA